MNPTLVLSTPYSVRNVGPVMQAMSNAESRVVTVSTDAGMDGLSDRASVFHVKCQCTEANLTPACCEMPQFAATEAQARGLELSPIKACVSCSGYLGRTLHLSRHTSHTHTHTQTHAHAHTHTHTHTHTHKRSNQPRISHAPPPGPSLAPQKHVSHRGLTARIFFTSGPLRHHNAHLSEERSTSTEG